ncbi:MAG: toprim domain-containing protein, partial [Candidatus Bathyarchaeia archaeon]
MYNGSTRQEILQEVLERLSLYGLRVRWSNSEKELARVQNVSVDNPNRLSRSFTASVTRGGRVILWNEGRTVSFPEYVRRVKNVMRVEDVRIEELLSEFSENGSYNSVGADPEKIKRAFERIKGYVISNELAYGLSEYGVMVLLRESFDEDREFIRNKLNQEGYRGVAERLFTRFERDPREFILVPMKADNEITGFYVRWRTFTETDLKHEYISVSRNLRMKLGSGKTKTVILTEGVIDALMVYMHNPDGFVLMRAGWMETLDGLFYVEDGLGNRRLRKDIKDFKIIMAFDKDRAGEGYSVDVVERYGFVRTYEWIWEGQEDIDEVLVKGKEVLPKPAVRFYIKAFQEELREIKNMPKCVKLFSQEENLTDDLSEDEVKVLLGLFPESRALRNYAFAFGLDVRKIKHTYSFCNSGLL